MKNSLSVSVPITWKTAAIHSPQLFREKGGQSHYEKAALHKPESTCEPSLVDSNTIPLLYTVPQFAAKHHQMLSENAIRALIFASKPRVGALRKGGGTEIPANGLAPAIQRVGRRVLLDEKKFFDWLKRQGASTRAGHHSEANKD